MFTLVYHLPKASDIYQRFPGVDGSLYYIGGAGINYQRLNGIVLAPIRLGVGLRAGASVGYMGPARAKAALQPLQRGRHLLGGVGDGDVLDRQQLATGAARQGLAHADYTPS